MNAQIAVHETTALSVIIINLLARICDYRLNIGNLWKYELPVL